MIKTVSLITVLGVAFALQQLSAEDAGKPLDAPKQIIQFYRDLNFAACFSTPSERIKLRRLHGDASKKLSQRLEDVDKTLTRIDAATNLDDANFLVLLQEAEPISAELNKIVSLHQELGTVRVEVLLICPRCLSQFL